MAITQHIYVRNKTDKPQIIRHPKLKEIDVIPVFPGGYTTVVNAQATIEPGQFFRVPISVWSSQMSLYRASWVERITEEEYRAAIAGIGNETDAEAEPEAEPEASTSTITSTSTSTSTSPFDTPAGAGTQGSRGEPEAGASKSTKAKRSGKG
jgi:hypothetical protein